MKISAIQNTSSFGRALTTKETREFENLQQDARRELGIDKTTATIFDFSVPSLKNDTGIGTSFSSEAQDLAGLLKVMCGVNSIQLQPQGEISNYVRSPYSGTGFSLGMHIIDLNKLGEDSYGNLLTAEDLNSSYMTRVSNHDSVNYDNVFAQDGQRAMLKRAFMRFEKMDEASPLKKEFKNFEEENKYWLERDALYEATAIANGSRDVKTWNYRDQNIFATKDGDQARIAELKQVRDEYGTNVVDFEKFVQFIADRQQKESKANFNKQGISIYGDCQIGFSQKDFWAHKSAFYPNYEFGCDIGDGKYSCWSPAINFDKINGEAGELLYNKFNLFFKRYDGVRIDAAWQLIKPMICEPWQNQGKDVFDSNGNKLGRKLDHQPKVGHNGQQIIKDIVLKAADDNHVPHDRILLELLGGNSYDSLDAVKNLGTTLIHITRYGGDNWGRVKYYESKGDNKYQNMKPGDYIIGPGTHDDYSLLEQVENGKERSGYLSKDLHLNKHELEHSQEALSKAVFAELFTTKNQFATLPDILGSRRRINVPNTTDGNWSYRASQDYEREYFENLSQGKGLNFADALSKAIKAKQNGRNSAITDKLDYFANILRQNGPMTRKDADRIILNA
ncbi:TPA: 4-alpha-glucanotransferase [Candidatus Avigastranaerophilus faecigallinarum]|nr:4-alpha-glucanotransferase [Candidatus Avigastranaerophilus faecigallinarum]